MGKVVRVLAAVCAVFGALAGRGSMAAPMAAPQSLSLLTYNVEGLPWPVRFGRAAQLDQIAAQLRTLRAQGRQPHIIVFQEAFTAEAKAIATKAGYRYVVNGPSKTLAGAPAVTEADRRFAAGASMFRGETEGKWADSGLRIASDYPIVAVRRMAYPSYACAGWDCMANKGALAVAIRVPGMAEPVAVVATHINSRTASKAPAARAFYAYQRQLDALGGFIRTVVPARYPLIVAGDLNVGPRIDRQAYLAHSAVTWRATAPVDVAMQNCLTDPACAKRNVTDLRYSHRRARDWQFFSSGARDGLKVTALDALFGRDRAGAMLSDHVGYVASYTITRATDLPFRIASR